MQIRPAAVGRKAKVLITDSWQSQANLSFFLALQILIAFVLPSLGFGEEHYQLYANIGFSVLLISGVAIAWGRLTLFVPTLVVGTIAVGIRWLQWRFPSPGRMLWADLWTLVAILLICFVLLVQVFREGSVTPARVQGAIAVYLLFGIGWAHAYHIVDVLHPGAFVVPIAEHPNVADWIYFSYATLSTLGYGDITPVRPVARTLATGEALTGQLYLAVLIARLVAMEVISWQERTSLNGKH